MILRFVSKRGYYPIVSFRSLAMASALKRKSDSEGGGGSKRVAGHWSLGLKTSMEDPELRVEADDKIVIIKDKYPKARHHYLVLPHDSIASLKKLTKDHIPLLKHMEAKGRELVKRLDASLDFRYGYHAIPSMSHVHMHVISQDFDSPCLKNKKHWNSFTTEYFIDSEDIIEMIEEEGAFTVNTSHHADLLKKDLSCHRCGQGCKTIPELKKHILRHIPASNGPKKS